jgi:uncharacterized protein YndB with AHSA1/START domain
MAAKSETIVKRNGKEITYTRMLNAPRELVWKAWTEPDHIKEWFGPNGFTITNKSMEVKAGASWIFTMHGFGKDFPNKIIFMEVIKPERLMYRHTDDDDSDPLSFHVTITFEQVGNTTKLTMHSIFSSAEELDRLNKEVNAIESGKQTLNRLDEYVTSMAIGNK